MTYVMSDIHGEYEKYIRMIKEIDEGQANTSDPTDDFIFEF